MVDEEMRDFISRGLSERFDVVGLSGEVEKVRQVKSEREIRILRAVNTGTVEAVRAVRGCLTLGLREDEVRSVLDETLRAGGLEPFFDIVLFGENDPLLILLSRSNLRRTGLIPVQMKAHPTPTAEQTAPKFSRKQHSY